PCAWRGKPATRRSPSWSATAAIAISRAACSRPERTPGSIPGSRCEGAGAGLAYRLSQLDHRHRIEARAVVSREDVEVARAERIVRLGVRIGQVDQRKQRAGGDIVRRLDAMDGELDAVEARLDARLDERADIGAGGDSNGHPRRRAPFPSVLGQEVGDASDRVLRRAGQVDPAVAVEVDGVVADAARHELRQADRSGIGAAHGQRIDAGVAREDEELFQFAPEEVAPPGKVEGERRERSGDREAPGMLPIDGLDPDDADDDLLGDTVARAGAGDGRFVLEPETQARTDSGSVDEALAIVLPGTTR